METLWYQILAWLFLHLSYAIGAGWLFFVFVVLAITILYLLYRLPLKNIFYYLFAFFLAVMLFVAIFLAVSRFEASRWRLNIALVPKNPNYQVPTVDRLWREIIKLPFEPSFHYFEFAWNNYWGILFFTLIYFVIGLAIVIVLRRRCVVE